MSFKYDPLAKEVSANCTCGQCIEGKMSGRMGYELLCTAKIQHYLLDYLTTEFWDVYETSQANKEQGSGLLDFFHQLAYIPEDIRDAVSPNKEFVVGYTKVMFYAYECLKKYTIPTVDAVMAELSAAKEEPPVTATYLQKGGKVEYALNFLLETAKSSNPVYGSEEACAAFQENLKKLPQCSNDNDFKLIGSLLFTPGLAGCTVIPMGAEFPKGYFERLLEDSDEENERIFRELVEMEHESTEEEREGPARVPDRTEEAS